MPGIPVSGEVITAVAITEPDTGSDMKTLSARRALREGGSYVLNGTKLYITNGVRADLYGVAAKTDPSAGSNGSFTMFLVEKGTPGFQRRPRTG